eukprot:scaffold11339_cov51-Cylindrotheca_fusiformis.AAC.1
MKFSTTAAAAAEVACAYFAIMAMMTSCTTALVTTTTTTTTIVPSLSTKSISTSSRIDHYKINTALRMTEGQHNNNNNNNSEIDKLRAAAAKAREEAAKLSKELGKDVDESGNLKTTTTTTTKAAIKERVSVDDLESLLTAATIDFEGGENAKSQTEKLNALVESGDLILWNSASSSSSLRTFPVSLQMLESRTNGQVTVEALGFGGGEEDVSLDDFKYATLGVTLGASIGSTAPGLIAGAIQFVRGTIMDDADNSQDELFDRICHHEAGYSITTTNTDGPTAGVPCVEFHPSQEGPVTGGGREFSEEEIAALSCVALS